MPTYTYKREDGSVFELEQRITEAALSTCPTTGQPVQRVITGGAGLVFKGSGFYLTDYARKNTNGSSDKKEAVKDSGKSSASTSDTSSSDTSKAAPKD